MLAAVLMLVLALASQASAGDPQARAQVQRSKEATVALFYIDGATKEKRYFCAGVAVRPDVVLTATHCIVDDNITGKTMLIDLVQFESLDGTSVRGAAILYKDLASDITFIRTAKAMTSRVAEITVDVAPGDPIILVGSMRHAGPFMVTYGKISKVLGNHFLGDNCDPDDKYATATQQWLYADVVAFFGNSGGPAFDSDGRVVGIVTGGVTGSDTECVTGDWDPEQEGERPKEVVLDRGPLLYIVLVGPVPILAVFPK